MLYNFSKDIIYKFVPYMNYVAPHGFGVCVSSGHFTVAMAPGAIKREPHLPLDQFYIFMIGPVVYFLFIKVFLIS